LSEHCTSIYFQLVLQLVVIVLRYTIQCVVTNSIDPLSGEFAYSVAFLYIHT